MRSSRTLLVFAVFFFVAALKQANASPSLLSSDALCSPLQRPLARSVYVATFALAHSGIARAAPAQDAEESKDAADKPTGLLNKVQGKIASIWEMPNLIASLLGKPASPITQTKSEAQPKQQQDSTADSAEPSEQEEAEEAEPTKEEVPAAKEELPQKPAEKPVEQKVEEKPEQPAPQAEQPAPKAAEQPKAEQPAPKVEQPEPKAAEKQPEPKVEQPASQPTTEQQQPVAEPSLRPIDLGEPKKPKAAEQKPQEPPQDSKLPKRLTDKLAEPNKPEKPTQQMPAERKRSGLRPEEPGLSRDTPRRFQRPARFMRPDLISDDTLKTQQTFKEEMTRKYQELKTKREADLDAATKDSRLEAMRKQFDERKKVFGELSSNPAINITEARAIFEELTKMSQEIQKTAEGSRLAWHIKQQTDELEAKFAELQKRSEEQQAAAKAPETPKEAEAPKPAEESKKAEAEEPKVVAEEPKKAEDIAKPEEPKVIAEEPKKKEEEQPKIVAEEPKKADEPKAEDIKKEAEEPKVVAEEPKKEEQQPPLPTQRPSRIIDRPPQPKTNPVDAPKVEDKPVEAPKAEEEKPVEEQPPKVEEQPRADEPTLAQPEADASTPEPKLNQPQTRETPEPSLKEDLPFEEDKPFEQPQVPKEEEKKPEQPQQPHQPVVPPQEVQKPEQPAQPITPPQQPQQPSEGVLLPGVGEQKAPQQPSEAPAGVFLPGLGEQKAPADSPSEHNKGSSGEYLVNEHLLNDLKGPTVGDYGAPEYTAPLDSYWQLDNLCKADFKPLHSRKHYKNICLKESGDSRHLLKGTAEKPEIIESSLVCCKEQDEAPYGSGTEAYPEGYKGETPWMYGEPPAGSCTLDVDYFTDGAKLTTDGLCVGTVKATCIFTYLCGGAPLHGKALSIEAEGVVKARPAKLKVPDDKPDYAYDSDHKHKYLPGTALIAYIPLHTSIPYKSYGEEEHSSPGLLKIKLNWYDDAHIVPNTPLYSKAAAHEATVEIASDGGYHHVKMPEVEPGTYNVLLKRGEYYY